MRILLFSAAVIAGAALGGFSPATATPLATPGLSSQSANSTLVEDVGWRRQYRRFGYPVPYAYPPAYGSYAPPPAAYYPPAYDAYAPPPVIESGEYAAEGDYGDYPQANGEYGDYPPPDGY